MRIPKVSATVPREMSEMRRTRAGYEIGGGGKIEKIQLVRVGRQNVVAATAEFRHGRPPDEAGRARDEDPFQKTVTRGMATANFPPHCRMCPICSITSSRMFHGRMSR